MKNKKKKKRIAINALPATQSGGTTFLVSIIYDRLFIGQCQLPPQLIKVRFASCAIK